MVFWGLGGALEEGLSGEACPEGPLRLWRELW